MFYGKPRVWLEILKKVEEAFKIIQEEFPKPNCEGVFLEIAELATGARTVLGAQIGSIPLEKGDKYQEVAHKKRSILYPLVKNADLLGVNFVASKQIADASVGEWGGAIYFDGFFFSVSGHTQKGDEALSTIASIAFVKEFHNSYFSLSPYSGVIEHASLIQRTPPRASSLGKEEYEFNEITPVVVSRIYGIDINN